MADVHSARIADDMEVGDDQTVRRDDEAGALSGIAAGSNAFDPAHGWTDAADGIGDDGGIGIEQTGIVRLRFGRRQTHMSFQAR
jgi:hypothetical protein